MKYKTLHIALVPDGNRRWARKKGFYPWLGHRAGVKTLEKILEKTRELKVPYLTFWGSSWDNLTKRPKTEVNFLFKLYTNYFKKAAQDKRIHQNRVRINVFGPWQKILPEETQEAIKKVQELTKNYNKYILTFLLAYNGTEEMRDCIQRIVNFSKRKSTKFIEKLIKENLWTKDLPPVDLVIRTGCEGDPHNSAGFMMWHTAYSQYYFTKTLFPDFSPREFEKAINNYLKRGRRFGR